MPNEKPRILVLDDATEVAEPVEQVLRRAGFEAVADADAERALERVARERFDLVVCDLRAPRLPGTELVSRLRRTNPTIPLVVVAGAGMAEAALAALKAGAADALTRPFEDEELLFRVRKALDCERLTEENCQLRQRVDSRFES